MEANDKVETMTFEKKRTDILTVTDLTIKNYETLSSVLKQECDIATKKSLNRPWIYLKEKENLKTFGGVRMNKNSIGTFYINTTLGHNLEDELFGVISNENEDYISNKISVKDLKGLKKMITLINNLAKENKLYYGKYA